MSLMAASSVCVDMEDRGCLEEALTETESHLREALEHDDVTEKDARIRRALQRIVVLEE